MPFSQESMLQSNQDASESSECDTDNSTSSMPRMSRSQSERLLAIGKEHVVQERDLREKYHEIVFSSLEKVMRSSQSNQMKMLRVLLDKETAEVMKKLQDRRRHEMKSLAKIHKDKDEIGRYGSIYLYIMFIVNVRDISHPRLRLDIMVIYRQFFIIFKHQ